MSSGNFKSVVDKSQNQIKNIFKDAPGRTSDGSLISRETSKGDEWTQKGIYKEMLKNDSSLFEKGHLMHVHK